MCKVGSENRYELLAVCNLASTALPSFVRSKGDGDMKEGSYDFKRLCEATKVATRNLNKVVDGNYYPVVEARNSNMRHRPVGLGVQGLADAFLMLRLPFESEAAQRLNEDIFETIYYAACEASCELADEAFQVRPRARDSCNSTFGSALRRAAAGTGVH